MATRVREPANQLSSTDDVRLVVADVSDDVSSVRNRLSALSGERVALVLPDRSDAFDTPAALHLVARLAAQESIRLAVVSGRRRVRYWAGIEGIRTFSAAEHVPSRVSASDDNLIGKAQLATAAVIQQLAIQLSWVAALLIVLFMVGLAILLVPHADVVVQPVTEQIGSTVSLRASPDVLTADVQKGLVPGRAVYLAVDSSGSLPVTGYAQQPDGRAVGFVTLTNATKEKTLVPAGTDVSTLSGAHFQTTQSVSLDGRPGATSLAPIRAQAPGTAGNVRRGEIVVMAPQLRWLVSVANDDSTAGGGQPNVAVVTALDTHKLVDQVTSKAQTLARERLAEQTTSGEIAVPESIKVEPIEQSFNHRVCDAASEIAVHMKFRASATIVNQDQIRSLATQMWNPTIPAGFELRAGSVEVDPPSVVKIDDSGVSSTAPIHAVIFKSINPDRVAQYVRLRTPNAAQPELTQLFDLAATPRITIVPNWIGRAYRVAVVVDVTSPPSAAAVATSTNLPGVSP